jgi:UDP-N-acetylglucosamine transferase subunit ALG13
LTADVNFNSVSEKPLVILSPLDWGLGHTTRCIPILRELTNLPCQILIACNSQQKAILEPEFPGIIYRIIPGYNLRYGKNRWRTRWRIIFQIPKILISINRENRWLKNILRELPVTAVISDNRFGLYNKKILTVFITHQLAIKTGLGTWTDRFIKWLNYRAINRFSECWLPDYKGAPALAGELSNPSVLPAIPVRYLGALSRFTPCQQPVAPGHLLFILSGPEPQRSLFEHTIRAEIEAYKGRVTVILGCPGNETPVTTNGLHTIYQHVDVTTLNELACSAEVIISRSGYTTVMDVLKLGKKSILVPTPGQTEQEYLADYLYRKRLAFTVSQDAFSLPAALQALAQLPVQIPAYDMDNYKTIVGEFVDSLRPR